MTDCRVFRRASTSTFWTSGKHAGQGVRVWVAICPHCNEVIRRASTYPYYDGRATRKNVKDALHWHVVEKHS